MTLGKRIRERRKCLGFSQAYIAKKIGLSQVAIQRWENESNEPSLESIKMLSEILLVTPDWLAFNIGKSPFLPCSYCGMIKKNNS
jgi:transcriptional regulator with XRE-family HTH domain